METLTTSTTTSTQIKDQYSFVETQLQDMRTELDPSGWIVKETGQIAEPEGIFIRLLGKQGETLAATVVAPAENSQFQTLTRLTQDALTNSVYISSVWVSPDAAMAEVLPAVLYRSLRRGRILGKENVVALIPVPNPDVPLATLMKMNRLENVGQITVNNKTLLPIAQSIKYSIHHIYNQCDHDIQKLINDNFGDEIVETHYAWLNRFYHGSWANAVLNGTLSKEQYISSLYNLHEYVRHTTRLCARAIAHSDDVDLRNHYINHFRGEINHELLIERDLKKLGADVDYLKTAHIPTPATKEFMTVQESTIGFYQDPVLMLACPLTAEGVAAHMRNDFIEKLLDTIQSWNVDEPIEAARFLTSHVNTDGGDDGHWANVIRATQKYIHDEHHLQEFLSVMTAAMNGFEHGFNANVDNLKLWSAKPDGDSHTTH